jgi:leucyl-tRNA synthetase
MEKKDKSKIAYSHKEVELKWQSYWEENKIFYTNLEDFKKPKKYILPMFPYPSGSGLHVGHVRNYTITDAMARFYRMMGFNVLLVTGWDAFGLPSEQYAIQTNNHPSIFTYENIQNFKKQLTKLGFSYDWSKEINTSDHNYYQWTQWIFKQIYLEGLAKYKNVPVFWCEELATVLSNEEIKNINGERFSERGSFSVVKKNISQWVLEITKYSHELVSGLDKLDWPLSIKNLQKNWIGISKGTNVKFEIFEKNKSFIEVFTTRVDTIYGVNSIALNPSDERINFLTKNEFKNEVSKFCEKWKSNDSFSKVNEELYGQFTGSYCLNPINKNLIPIWITNFSFADYGTGSVMISPFPSKVLEKCNNINFLNKKEIEQNTKIDLRFSKKYNLPISDFVYLNYDQNGEYDILYLQPSIIDEHDNKEAAILKITNFLELNNLGYRNFSYHLKDWVFSRQRYWGEPIPVIHLKNGNNKLIDDKELPLKLPYLTNFVPSSQYYSPLQKVEDWVNVKVSGEDCFRDVNVMPQWAGSCWYYIAFLLRTGNKDFTYLDLNSEKAKKIIDHWLPVDLYVGGQEHANLHLLYSRFWHKILKKREILSEDEPFKKLLCQGMILGKNGEKMSKSKGNTISPDYCIDNWGSDSLRLYEIFLGPPDQASNFNINGVISMKKWINRVYSLFVDYQSKFVYDEYINKDFDSYFQKMVVEVTGYYHDLKLNLVVAKLMSFINKCYLSTKISVHHGKVFLQLLNPLAPHVSEELWNLFEKKSISFSNWPELKYSKSESISIVVQINGKKKDVISGILMNCGEKEFLKIIENNHKISSSISNKKIKKTIFIKNKLINLILE